MALIQGKLLGRLGKLGIFGALGNLGASGKRWFLKSWLWLQRAGRPLLFHLAPILRWVRSFILAQLIKKIQWPKLAKVLRCNLVHISVVCLALLVVFGNLSTRSSGLTVIPTGAKKTFSGGMPALGSARPANLIATSNEGLIIKAAPTRKATPAPQAPAPAPAPQAASGYFAWPVWSPNITQYYGATSFNPWHTGVDMTSGSLAILASDAGWVEGTFWDPYGYGTHIIINHGNGYETLYGHLSESWVYPGQFVAQGQQIGVMGSTGWSTGTHLHFEVRSGGVPLNPFAFLP